MTPIPSLTPSSANASPIRILRSSDSTTHGPATRNGPFSAPKRAMSVGEFRQLARRLGARLLLVVIERRADETGKQRTWAHRPRLQLGMELAADEPRMTGGGQLDHFHQRSIGGEAGAAHAVLGEHVAIGVRDLVAVPVTLAHFGGVVGLRHV